MVMIWDVVLGSLKEGWPEWIGVQPAIKEKLNSLVLGTCKRVFLREGHLKNVPTDFIILFLGRICVEDFCEIIYLASLGLGVGAQKLLQDLFERAVTVL